jgi:hypothetical protein
LLSILQIHAKAADAEISNAVIDGPKGLIYIDSLRQDYDTLDFDITLFGYPVSRFITFENTGTERLTLPQDVFPFFSLEQIKPGNVTFREFQAIPVFPFEIPAGAPTSKRLFEIRYESRTDTSTQLEFRLGKKEALVRFSLRSAAQQENIVKERNFILRAWKSKDYLASRDTVVSFDSVYVGAPAPITLNWRLKNISPDKRITISGSSITPLTTVIGTEELGISGPGAPVFLPVNTPQNIELTYQPRNIGWDSSLVTVYYSPNIDGRPDSARVIVRGFGVRQSAVIDNATTGSPNIPQIFPVADSLHAGDVALGDSTKITLVIRNTGNTTIGLREASFLGDAAALTSFRIVKSPEGNILPIGGTDTIVVVFAPTVSGSFLTRLLLNTDLQQRIPGAPPSAKVLAYSITGRALSAQLEVQDIVQDKIDFGEVILPAKRISPCIAIPATRVIRIKNSGNARLSVEKPFISPAGSFFLLSPTERFSLAPADSALIILQFVPGAEGVYSDTLEFLSNAAPPGQRKKLVLNGKGIQAPAVKIALPHRISAAGIITEIPLISDKNWLTISSSFSSRIFFDDSTLLTLAGIRLNGGAAEGGIPTFTVFPGGADISIRAAGSSFLPSDTLAWLRFATYAGLPTPSLMAFGSSKLGRADCDSVFTLQSENGSYTPDSACGSGISLIRNARNKFTFSAVTPIQEAGKAVMHFTAPVSLPCTIDLYSVQGIAVQRVFDGMAGPSPSEITMNTAILPPGIYYCVYKAGLYSSVQPIIITN